MNLDTLKTAPYGSYTKDLCYPKVRDNRSINNKTLGMCAITALIINDYFGGQICKTHINEVSHYFNLIDQKIVDLTSEQFKCSIVYENYTPVERETILTEDTRVRYKALKQKVIKQLLSQIDEKIYKCNSCKSLIEKFPNSNTVYLGEDTNIVLVGEAPANNGWRKSHKVWVDPNGKVLPSGIILQKLFNIIDENIFETTFLEAVKCFPLDRKNLKTCTKNCKAYMLEQLSILNPKLIITLGEFPAKTLLNLNYKKFSDIVGNIYEVDGYKILPIYHPSPISPMSYKGNVPIFENLKNNKPK